MWAASNGANRNPKRGTSVSLERQAIGQLIQKTETKAPSLFAVNHRVRGQMSLRIVAAEDTSRRPSTSACGTKQTFAFVALKSAFNPKQTFASRGEADAATGVHLHQLLEPTLTLAFKCARMFGYKLARDQGRRDGNDSLR